MIPIHRPRVTHRDMLAVLKQMYSGRVGVGDAVSTLERELAEYFNAEYCICTNSGTSAILAALLALSRRNKTITFPAYTMPAGANVAKLLGYKIKLVDVDAVYGVMNDVYSNSIYVHHNIIGDPDGMPLMEDRAQVFMAGPLPLRARVAIYSFSAPKHFTTGQGGCVVTNDGKLYDRLAEIIRAGNTPKGKHHAAGLNLRMSDISAAYGLSQMAEVNKIIDGWRRIRQRYVSNGIGNPRTQWTMTTISCYPSELIDALRREGYEAARLYKPLSWLPQFKSKEYYKSAEVFAYKNIYLPSYLGIENHHIDRICEVCHAEG